MPRVAALPQVRGSLAALLDEAADELLGIGLEHAVDLVEDGVDVGVEVLLAGAGLRCCGSRLRPVVGRVVPALWSALLLARHVRPSALVSNVPACKPSPTLARCGGQLAQQGGGVR